MALLFLKLNNIPNAAIHRLLGVNHKAIEDMSMRLHELRKEYVEMNEKQINFASGVKWSDVEADETTFDRQNMGAFADNKATPIAWEQWCGLVKRGHPDTLVLHRLRPKMSEVRAPGPGAIRKSRVDTFGQQMAQGQAGDPTHRRCKVLQVPDPGRGSRQGRPLQEESQD